MKTRTGKKSSRELRRLAAQRRDHAWRMMGDVERVAYTGANADDVLVFLNAYGCTADVVHQLRNGNRYITLVIQPVGLVLKPGHWLIRVLRYDANDLRGWKARADTSI